MYRVLIVSIANSAMSGGAMASRSNYDAFTSVADCKIIVLGTTELNYADVRVNAKLSTTRKLISYVTFTPAVNLAAYRRELEKSALQNHDIIFVDSSLLGLLIPSLRRANPNATIVVFYHNIEAASYLSMMNKLNPLHWLRCASIFRAERAASKHSDIRITLHATDGNRLKSMYAATSDLNFPIVYPTPDLGNTTRPIPQDYVLFVGGYYKPNLEAIRFLDSEVAPFVDKSIVAAGFGLGRLARECTLRYVKIIDSPVSLAPWYQHANLVLAPVFSGGGLKTKIIEALSYGKRVVATPAAGVGFERFTEASILISDSSAAFIKHINDSEICGMKPCILEEYTANFSVNSRTEKVTALFRLVDEIKGKRAQFA